MKINIFLALYLCINCFILGAALKELRNSFSKWRLLIVICCFQLFSTIFYAVLFAISYMQDALLWTQENTPVFYWWKWHTGFYDKLKEEDRQKMIARIRWKIKYATNHDKLKERKWEIFIKHANKVLKKYDPDNKIEANAYA